MRLRVRKRMAFYFFGIFTVLAFLPVLINLIVVGTTRSRIHARADAFEPAEAILLLGARTYNDGGVSQVVYDRILKAVELYRAGRAEKILVSGDHGTRGYDEVNTIKTWLLRCGVPEEDLFLDHAGFSTYESVYRAREIFGVKSMIIVTQRFHLPRALFTADRFGIASVGAAADRMRYRSHHHNNFREFLARNKDFVFSVLIQPKPTFLGDPIPLSGDGRRSWDQH